MHNSNMHQPTITASATAPALTSSLRLTPAAAVQNKKLLATIVSSKCACRRYQLIGEYERSIVEVSKFVAA